MDNTKLFFSVFLLVFLAIFVYFVTTHIDDVATATNPDEVTAERTALQEFISQVRKFAKENEFILATAWVGIIGSITTSLYFTGMELFEFLTRNFNISITLSNTNDSFDWFMEYLGEQHSLRFHNPDKKPILVSFVTSPTLRSIIKPIKDNSGWGRSNDKYGEEGSSKISFIPDNGFHVFTFKGKIFWFTKNESDEAVTTGWDESTSFKLQSCQLNMFGSVHDPKNRQILQELFDYSISTHVNTNTDVTKVYVLHQWRGWTMAMARRKRPFESLILDGDTAENLLDDANVFLSKKKWYAEKGIPFRRGYLLYGVPGAGKSSFVTVLAAKLNLNICVLSLSGGNLDDQGLMARLHDAPARSIILLEDIDAIFLDRNMPAAQEGGRGRGKNRSVTFSGLLNALDGVHAAEDGRILFLTTNHIERLDPALLRAGRCDVKVEFKYASPAQLRRGFERFFPQSTKEQVEQFMKDFEDEKIVCTMAQFTEFLCRFKGDLNKVHSKGKEFAAELRQQQEYTLNAAKSQLMPIEEWLRRLSLTKYTQQFKSMRISTIEDIKDSCHDHFVKSQLKIKETGEKQRLIRMVRGDKQLLADFQLATPTDIKKAVLETFPGVDISYVTEFTQQIPKSKVSICQIKVYLSSFKMKMIYENLDAKQALAEAIDPTNLDTKLFNPPIYHLKVPQHLSNYMNPKEAHKIMEHTIQFESTDKWLNRLNDTYQWYDPSEDPNPTIIEPKKEEKKEEEKKSETTSSESKSEEKKEDKKEEPQIPDTKANLLKRFLDNGLTTSEFLLNLSDGDLKGTYCIKKKGRRSKILKDLASIKKQVDELKKLKEEVQQLYDLA